MSIKTFLKIVLGVVIIIFVVFAFKWKSGEHATQAQYVESHKVNTDIVESNTRRMMIANAQAEFMMSQENEVAPGLGQTQSSTEENSQIQLYVSRTYFIKSGDYFGCTQKDALTKLLKFSASGETARFNKLWDKMTKDNDCTVFKQKEPVIAAEISPDNSMVKVSRPGEDKTWWTTAAALRKY